MAQELAATLALVAANAFFVATEFAIARLQPTQVAELERQGAAGATSVRHAVEHIDAYLSACQLGITLASLGLGVVGKPFFITGVGFAESRSVRSRPAAHHREGDQQRWLRHGHEAR